MGVIGRAPRHWGSFWWRSCGTHALGRCWQKATPEVHWQPSYSFQWVSCRPNWTVFDVLLKWFSLQMVCWKPSLCWGPLPQVFAIHWSPCYIQGKYYRQSLLPNVILICVSCYVAGAWYLQERRRCGSHRYRYSIITSFESIVTRHTFVQTGVFEGGEISMYYDPMICKLVTWAPERKEAIRLQVHYLALCVVE